MPPLGVPANTPRRLLTQIMEIKISVGEKCINILLCIDCKRENRHNYSDTHRCIFHNFIDKLMDKYNIYTEYKIMLVYIICIYKDR